MNQIVRTTATALGVLILWMCASGVAGAHTTLARSDPARDATVPTPPSAIVLTFTEDINPAFANVAVSSEDGHNWVSGSPRVEGPRLTAAVGPDRPVNGVYTVGYRVVSADGHPVTGSYSFIIAGAPDVSTPTSSAPSTAAAPPPSAAPAGADTKTSVITAAIAGLALGGLIAFWQSRRHRRKNAADADAPQSSSSAADDGS